MENYIFAAVAALIALTAHEYCHGYAAYRLGDPTAKSLGRLTLNPLHHLDLLGALCMILFRFGWAKPVPINPRYFKNPKKGFAIVALAGPAINLFLSFLSAGAYLLLFALVKDIAFESDLWFNIVKNGLLFLFVFHSLNLGFALFNLIPIPPLDGSKVLFSFLPDEIYRKILRYERYFMILLFALVATRVLSGVLSTSTGWIVDRLWVFAQWGFALALKFVG